MYSLLSRPPTTAPPQYEFYSFGTLLYRAVCPIYCDFQTYHFLIIFFIYFQYFLVWRKVVMDYTIKDNKEVCRNYYDVESGSMKSLNNFQAWHQHRWRAVHISCDMNLTFSRPPILKERTPLTTDLRFVLHFRAPN